MTDPLQNPQTGHGVECLCNECFARFVQQVTRDREELRGTMPTKIMDETVTHGGRVVRCVMTDGTPTKDGLS